MTTRHPIHTIFDNLVFGRDGSVWAVWRVDGVPYLHARFAEKKMFRALIRRLFPVAPEEILLAGLVSPITPHEIVSAETTGVDLDAHSGALDVASARLSHHEELEAEFGPALRRSHWLAARLPEQTGWGMLGAAGRAAVASVGEMFGFPPRPVTDEAAAHYTAAARKLTDAWPKGLGIREASSDEVLWWLAHQQYRGTPAAPALPDPDQSGQLAAQGIALAGLSQAKVREGGARDDELGDLSRRPMTRRYLRVDTEMTSSYQSLLVIGDLPRQWLFPGTEWLIWVDEFAFAVDYAVRIQLTANAKARAKARRQARNIADQAGEFDDDTAGVPPEVAEAAAAVSEEEAQLAATKTDPELVATVVLTVAGQSVSDVLDRGNEVAAIYTPEQFPTFRPLGDQVPLWTSTIPGVPPVPVLADYRQYLLPAAFSSAIPFCDTTFGDPAGPIHGVNLDGPGHNRAPVRIDLAAGPPARSSSIMVVGELGSGKSATLMSLAGPIAARGGQVAVIDHTEAAEWVRYADALPHLSSSVVALTQDAAFSFDPLRVFTGSEAELRAEGFLSSLLGISSQDEEGLLLSEAIQAQRSGSRGLTVLIDDLVDRGRHDPVAALLARKLTACAHREICRPFFDPGLPPLRLTDADVVVVHTPNLPLPDKSALASPDQRRQLRFEEIYAPSALYVASAVCRGVAFARLDRFSLIVLDECWWLKASQAGQQLQEETTRECRRHNAAVLYGGHNARDLANETVLGLVPLRIVLRTTDPHLAELNMRVLGRDPDTDTGLLDLISTPALPAGQGLFRDRHGRVGHVQITLPIDAGTHHALMTALPATLPTSNSGGEENR